jgi:hypothetical protein
MPRPIGQGLPIGLLICHRLKKKKFLKFDENDPTGSGTFYYARIIQMP